MQFEISQSFCPLCRRTSPASGAGLAPGSRLCDQCRNIVQEAFPGPASRVLVSTPASQNNGAMARAHQGAAMLDLSPIDSSEFIEDDSGVDSFEQDADFLSPTSFELNDDVKSDLRE